MLNQEVAILLNEQINKELYSAYLYLDIANYYSDQGLAGFENWFYVQMQEEFAHAMLFRKYLLNLEQIVKLTSIDAPTKQYKDFKEPLLDTLEHEKFVTASINNIYDKAYQSKDFQTMQFLDWFVKEQGEEEKNSNDLIKKYDLFGSDSKGLYMLDNELSTRIFTAPSLVI
ncbi:MAG: ferritin [Clostridiales bacterium]|jgi:ferritin|nr:ferritin [Clostridiales bacterium]